MIGVLADDKSLETAREFFQLFKTPWEPVVQGREYDAVIATRRALLSSRDVDTRLLLVFGAEKQPGDREAVVQSAARPVEVAWADRRFPLFRGAALFPFDASADVSGGSGSLDYELSDGECRQRRIGYDLFAEVEHLLTDGQPEEYALAPTLEIHIELLRHWLARARVPYVEVLPQPSDGGLICCLTHDVDFVGLRRHLLDRTLLGFLARASIGTASDVLRRRRPVDDLVKNLAAIRALPGIFLGRRPDPWQPFDAYEEVEDPSLSTFYLVPFNGRPGVGPDGKERRTRAVRYELDEVAGHARRVVSRGGEVGVHGIDAWRDVRKGKAELSRVAAVGSSKPGVRMHWLYYDKTSPQKLEAAGFSYDSTWGYNGRIGHRAGTGQVFRLSGTRDLLELPLTIMDSALFSAGRMNLTENDAFTACRRVIDDLRRSGGALVINWHCRSLAPERLWGRFYRRLLRELRGHGQTHFMTAGRAVDWFRWRRGVTFSERRCGGRTVVEILARHTMSPPALVRIHRSSPHKPSVQQCSFDGSATTTISEL